MNTHQIEPPRASLIAEQLVFKTLWDKVPKKSFISGLWLRDYFNTPLWANCFCRVLPVKQYPYLKYYFGNIILLTPAERALWDQCTEESLIHYSLEIEEKTQGRGKADWDAIKELEKDLLVLYKRSFPVTYKGIIGYKYSLDEQKQIVGALNKEFWETFK